MPGAGTLPEPEKPAEGRGWTTFDDPDPTKLGPETPDEKASKVEALKAEEKNAAEKQSSEAAAKAAQEKEKAWEERIAKAELEAKQSQAYANQIIERLRQAAVRPDANGEGVDLRERLNENPEAVLDEHFKSRIAPLAEMSLANQANVNLQMMDARMANDEDWQKYRVEVVAFMEKTPVELRAQPNSWDKAFNLVKSEHLDEIIERKSTKRAAVERAAFVEPPSGAAKPAPKKPQLSDVQKQIARGLDMTDDEYIEWMR